MAFEIHMTQGRGKTGELIILHTVIRSWITYTLHIKCYDERQENERGGGQGSYHSLNATVAQSKNCPFGVNTTIEIKNRRKRRVVGTVTVIGTFSFFCALIRCPAIKAPSLNDIRIHGCLVFHVVLELPNASTLLNVAAACNRRC